MVVKTLIYNILLTSKKIIYYNYENKFTIYT